LMKSRCPPREREEREWRGECRKLILFSKRQNFYREEPDGPWQSEHHCAVQGSRKLDAVSSASGRDTPASGNTRSCST
jgi:hypothetical protein